MTHSIPQSNAHQPPFLDAENITLARGPHILIEQLSFSLDPGQTGIITGANGAGKTSLLRLCAGLLLPLSGTVTLGGYPPASQGIQNGIHFIGNETPLHDGLSARETLDLMAALYTAGAEQKDRAMKELDLHTFLDTCIEDLSAGQCQRLNLARLYLSTRRLWLLDEPDTALDSRALNNVRNTIRLAADEGVCILIASHRHDLWDPDLYIRLDHQIADNGRDA